MQESQIFDKIKVIIEVAGRCMKKRRNIIIMLIIVLTIGFASVSTTLVLNGIVAVGEKKDDFEIIFTSAKLNERQRNDFISEDKKHLEFISNELKTLDDIAKLEYEVTNTSRNYDADVSVTCSAGSNGLIEFDYLPKSMEVLAGTKETGTFTAAMFKVVDEPVEVKVECTLTAVAKSRESIGEEYVAPFSKSGVMMEAQNDMNDPTNIWKYRNNVTKIEFENRLLPHETDEQLILDVSSAQDGSVMAYLVPNGETLSTNTDVTDTEIADKTAYTLFIQGNTGVKANPNCLTLFGGFVNLLQIDGLEYFDTSQVVNMDSMFNRCINLKTLNIDYFDTRNVTDMTHMFALCTSLTKLDLVNFDTSNVTDLSYMFYSCISLSDLDISTFDISSATDIGRMFWQCVSLTSLDLSNFNGDNVQNVYGMFAYCSGLEEVTTGTYATGSLTDMTAMFVGCSNLEKINFGNINTSNVTTMYGLFCACESLKTLDLSMFSTSKVTDMYSMFEECKLLKNLDLSGFDFTSVTEKLMLFSGMPDNAIIKVKDTVAQDYIIGLTRDSRPSAWTTDNVLIKEAL